MDQPKYISYKIRKKQQVVETNKIKIPSEAPKQMIAPEVKTKKPMITPEERKKQNLANTLFSGGNKPKETTKAPNVVPKKENPPKDD